ncbi:MULTISPECIES: carboxymuconolactone decarboxylase family protein [unclassified Mesorhizobium]|uniref:carboxymuconolactone decarboxylase family protein n=1 Tax=unclassified Mesorhizobium TaxID=325217 RepID=UPI000FDA2CAF|nr:MULTISPECIES: carboxymuconolactone decarboxylase family protein [unclassified Mesorhizobium]TGR17936.1 carboxymuconolactone decarboxylase family protein [Mesorhizobium sp. M8A.F.Ca.ET.197.01.1.1]TGR36580.1 carboxymuconolactone decarboxylase family protein [bacterium M00.F.Ca.ET.199.01.1.1]TGR40127.1 carboxymuconolactone decarboxylase family protein [Mesorhizobium sp. M8A.F.Ca.ET.198.01.1.1]TGV81634.1 carboxymuconolactone decarboxylase family protein [Mesorhizobium sp. M00.F.Ca.ET.149.01.1.1]
MSDKIRFPTPEFSAMTADQQQVAQAIIDSPRKGIRGPFPALLRRPAMADATRLLGDCVRFNSSLSDAIRELAILTVVRHWHVDVEWASHKKIALEAGLSETLLFELEAGRRPADMTVEQAVAYDVVNDLISRNELSENTYERGLAQFGEVGLVDLIGATAYYNYICVIMNGMASPLPPGVVRLPR